MDQTRPPGYTPRHRPRTPIHGVAYVADAAPGLATPYALATAVLTASWRTARYVASSMRRLLP